MAARLAVLAVVVAFVDMSVVVMITMKAQACDGYAADDEDNDRDDGGCCGYTFLGFGVFSALFGLVPVQTHACLGVARCIKSGPVFMRRCFVTPFP